ncbi:MAG: M28 family peptidase [Bacteroidales bacterium]|nr:M28 family peptidase [Bacteroidales bacterium]
MMEGFHSISSNDIQSYMEILCQPEWEGRRAGTPGYLAAAQFVVDSFTAWGLQPANHGLWYQTFDHEWTEIKDAGQLSIKFAFGKDSISKQYNFPSEFFPGSSSANGTISAPAIWVGFGITAPELNYDDYQKVDVKGKIVVVETEIPVNAKHPDFAVWAVHSSTVSKCKNAINHGAVGLIFVDKLANPSIPYHPNFIYCYLKKSMVNDLFVGTKFNRNDLIEHIKTTLQPQSFSLGKEITITAHTQHHLDGKCCNVVGLLEGSDSVLKNEIIILGAHLDGVGNAGAFFPGALDNASGSVDVMTIAQGLAQSKVDLKRSILFILLGAEETGLRGSTYYVTHPIFPPEKVVCMFNFDMVGNGKGLGLWGGTSFPEILKHFQEANEKYIHRPMQSWEYSDAGGRPRTDGMIFGRAGYTTLAATVTDRVKPVFYHDIGDTPDMVVPEIMEDICRWFYLALIGMANE